MGRSSAAKRMSNPVIPSHDLADRDSLAGVLKLAFRKTLESTDGQLPCEVISYNRTTNRALVQPLIGIVLTSGEQVVRAQIASVPVLALGGGGFAITFPLAKGDLGWIEASDQDISLFMQQMQQSKPNTFRIHTFEDGRFVPDAFAQYTFNSADAANMVIQSYDGTVKIALGPGVINLDAPTVNVNATTMNATVSGKATISAAEIDLVGAGGTPLGMVTGGCIDSFTGQPYSSISATIKGTV